MLEEFIQNGPGIDTQEERDQINYRPNVEYTPEEIDMLPYMSIENPFSLDNNDVLAEEQVTEIWNQAQEIIKSLEDMKKDFYDKLKDDFATVPDSVLNGVIDAAKHFGFDITGNSLPFTLYEEALGSEDSIYKDLILDAFDSYYTDTNGNLRGEIYPDIVNMIEDWENMIDFIRIGLMSQFVSVADLPTEDSESLKQLEKIASLEQSLIQQYQTMKKNLASAEDGLREIYMQDGESDRYYASYSQYVQANKVFTQAERKLSTKREVSDLILYKINDTLPTLTYIDNMLDYEPYKSKAYDSLYSILNQYSSGQSMENGLRKIQAMIRLSIDGKIDAVGSVKADASVIANNKNKRNANTSLSQGVHVRNEIYSEVNVLLHSVSSAENETLDMIAGYMTEGLGKSDAMYAEQASDFFKIHGMGNELQRDKLSQIQDKDWARQLYNIIDSLLSYAGSKGWPSGNLSSWLQAFLKENNLD